MKKLVDRQCDIYSAEIGRTAGQALRAAILPFRGADFGGGPGFGLLLRLAAWHRFGRLVCMVLVRWERPMVKAFVFARNSAAMLFRRRAGNAGAGG